MTYDVTLIPGDGIGPEITAETVRVLEATGLRFNWDEELAGMAAVDATGTPLPDATVESIRQEQARPQGSAHDARRAPASARSTSGSGRNSSSSPTCGPPSRSFPAAGSRTWTSCWCGRTWRGSTSGWSTSCRSGDDPRAVGESMAIVTRRGCERIVRYAFDYALRHKRRKVTIVHKANILKMVSGLFLEVGRQVAAEYAGRVESNDMIVDNTAMQLVLRPEQFDVMVTTNMFGDILSDEVSGLVGGLGLAPGANIGTEAAIFEAVHGSAPDIAGKGIANPSAQMLAAAMMLDHIGELDRAERVRRRRGGHDRPRQHPDPRPGRHRIHRGVRECCRPAGGLRFPARGATVVKRDCRGVRSAPNAAASCPGVRPGSPTASPWPRRR